MRHREGRFAGAGGLELYGQAWLPPRPRARLVVAHGFGEHGGRYRTLVDHLVPRGVAVHALDHRGHGRSAGQRGHIGAWAEYRADLDLFVRAVAAEEPVRPLFLLGHSMGALITLDYVLREPVPLAGVVISAASVRPVGVASPLLVYTAKALSQLWPTFSLAIGVPPDGISRDPAAVVAYKADPLVHDRGSARWGTEVLSAIDWIFANVAGLRQPVLMIHGTADPIASAAGTRELFDLVRHRDKKLRLYPGGFHEPLNDVNRKRVAADVAHWIENRLGPRGGRKRGAVRTGAKKGRG